MEGGRPHKYRAAAARSCATVRLVSYDLAVWAGPRPSDDAAALTQYERRASAAELSDEPPSPVIDAFLTSVLSRYPDQDDEDAEYGPWATGTLREDAHGDFAHVTTVPGTPTDVLLWIAQTAAAHGLVCYDPQIESVLSP